MVEFMWIVIIGLLMGIGVLYLIDRWKHRRQS